MENEMMVNKDEYNQKNSNYLPDDQEHINKVINI